MFGFLKSNKSDLEIARKKGKKIVHLLHIGKTGGTVIKDALRAHTDLANGVLIFHNHDFKLKDCLLGEKVVFFLRDPITRFVSGFHSRKRQGKPRYNSPWTASENVAFANFNSANQIAENLTNDNGQHAMNSIEHVKTHFSDWLGDIDYYKSRKDDILFVGFLETLNEDFEKLITILNLPPHLQLSTDPVKAHKNIDSNETLSELSIANLKDWFSEDYNFIKTINLLKK